jgi:hypothetical protein
MSSLHPVFHVSQLKRFVSSNRPVSSSLPDALPEFQVPERILQCRIVSRGIHSVVQVMVQWSASPASLATWEDLEALKQRLPDAPAWGQASSFGGGNVTATDEITELEPENKLAGNDELNKDVSLQVKKPSAKVYESQWV